MRNSTLFLLFTLYILHAAPMNGKEFYFVQPDSSKVPVKVFGDEFFQSVESSDGYTLIRDSDGWICYAKKSNDGELRATSQHYTGKPLRNTVLKKHLREAKEIQKQQRAENRKQYGLPTIEDEMQLFSQREIPEPVRKTDTIWGLTILIDFPDKKSDVYGQEISNMINQEGYTGYGNNGSVRNFFSDASDGRLEYINVVTTFYTAKNYKGYYDDPNYGRAQELITESIQWLQSTGFDFSRFTAKDGSLQCLNIFYAGQPDHGWAKGLWPHKGTYLGNLSVAGKRITNYQITNIGTSLDCYTFIHENGHLLCDFPDLYSYDTNLPNALNGTGVMASPNAYNPIMFNPYFRALMGWMDLHTLTDSDKGKVFVDYANDNDCYLWGAGPEYFFIENRARHGRSANLAGDGMMIWHINRNGTNTQFSNSGLLVALEQADGQKTMEGGGWPHQEDWFYYGNNNRFNDYTVPNAVYTNGAASGLDVANISSTGYEMSFSLGEIVDKNDPELQVTHPNGGELFSPGNVVPIRWNTNVTGTVEIVLLKEMTPQLTIAKVSGLQGQYDWIMPTSVASGNYTIGIVATEASTVYDVSDGEFAVASWRKLDQRHLSVLATDSEEPFYEAVYTIDGNPKTLWYTSYSESMPNFPHYITLECDTSVKVTAFEYTGRTDGATEGNVKAYVVEASADGQNWTSVSSGTFSGNGNTEIVTFTTPMYAKQIRFTALSEVHGYPFATASEVNLYYEHEEKIEEDLLQVSSPNGGEHVFQNGVLPILWDSNLKGNINIVLLKDMTPQLTIATVPATQGRFDWKVNSDIVNNTYTIGIISEDNNSLWDVSNAPFTIANLQKLNQTHLVAIAADSEESQFEAKYVLDGNSETFWHTEYSQSLPSFPHCIIFSCDTLVKIAALEYTGRTDGNTNGNVTQYEIQISSDGQNWETVSLGAFSGNGNSELAIFNSAVRAKQIKFLALAEVSGYPFASASEINLYYAHEVLQPNAPVLLATRPQKIKEDSQILLDLSMVETAGGNRENLKLIVEDGVGYSVSGVHVIPDVNYNGTLQVSVAVSDGEFVSNYRSLAVEVEPVDDKAVLLHPLQDKKVFIDEVDSIPVVHHFLDVDDVLIIEIMVDGDKKLPAWMTFANGKLMISPEETQEKEYNIVIKAASKGGVVSDTCRLSIVNPDAIIEVDSMSVKSSDLLSIVPTIVTPEFEEVLCITSASLKGEQTISIYDKLGNLIDESVFSGVNTAYKWDVRNIHNTRVASGTYAVVLTYTDLMGQKKRVKKLVAVKK